MPKICLSLFIVNFNCDNIGLCSPSLYLLSVDGNVKKLQSLNSWTFVAMEASRDGENLDVTVDPSTPES